MKLAATVLFGLILCAAVPLQPQSPVELEEILFVQNAKTPPEKGAIYVLWIPQPVLKYCLGKSAEKCARIDFCIRTTSKEVSTCQNLGLDARACTGIRPAPARRASSESLISRRLRSKAWTFFKASTRVSQERHSIPCRWAFASKRESNSSESPMTTITTFWNS